MRTIKIDRKYLTNEVMQFRGIMCSRKHTLRQKDDAFNGLVYAFLRRDKISADDQNAMIILFQATAIEWERRRLYEVFHSKI